MGFRAERPVSMLLKPALVVTPIVLLRCHDGAPVCERGNAVDFGMGS
jgi:hypothetical protein